LQRTTHHLVNIPAEYPDYIQVEFGIIWDTDGNDWKLSDIFVDMAEPDVYTREELRAILLDHVNVHGISPIEGDTDETSCDVD
jgi:hypothetical protein